MGRRCALHTQLFFCVILPFCSQISAVFSPYWVKYDGVHKGLVQEMWADDSMHGKVLDPGVLAMQLVAGIILFETMVNSYLIVIFQGTSCSEQYHTKMSRFNRICFKINIFLYFPVSCLILTACILFSNKHPMELIGQAFYMSLSACLMMWLSICVFICDQLCKEKTERNVFHSLLVENYYS